MLDTKYLVEEIRERHNLAKDAKINFLSSLATKSTVDMEQRLIRATATSNRVDLSDEIVLQDGCDWSYIDANKKILVDHKNSLDTMVGVLVNRKATSRVIDNKLITQSWQILVHVLPLSKNKYCDDILTIAQHAGIGMSIGFQAIETDTPTREEIRMFNNGVPFSSIIRKSKILEVSFVALPCNVDAQSLDLAVAAKSKLIDMAAKNMISSDTLNLLDINKLERKRGVARKIIVL